MKTKNLVQKTFSLLSLGLITLLITSCESNESVNPENDYDDLINESYASEVFDEVEDVGDEAVDYLDNISTSKSASDVDGHGNYNRLSPCATVTEEQNGDTINVTIDFGEENCLCDDGRERRGKIYINHYGYYWDGEVEIEFTFEDFFVDDNQLTGTKNVFRTFTEEGNRLSEIIVDGAMILSDDEGIITWHAERTRELIEGSGTREKSDDVIEVTGSSYSTLADSSEISSEIISPLVKTNEEGCSRYFVSGIRTIIKGEEPEITVDFGDETCDNLAEITQDGITKTVEIRRRKKLIW